MKKTLSSFSYVVSILFISLLMLIPKAHAFTVKSYIGDGTLGINSLEDLLLALLNVLIVIAIPIVVLFIIYAGFMYVTARGNAEQTQQATRTLTYAIVGGVMIIGAVAISEILANVVDSFTV